jgi:hypothetical protein
MQKMSITIIDKTQKYKPELHINGVQAGYYCADSNSFLASTALTVKELSEIVDFMKGKK